MYLAMNRFKVKKDRAEAFEDVWLNRDSDLHKMEGFVEFHLLKGPDYDDFVLYSSHTFWETEDSFKKWTESPEFAKAHAKARTNKAEPMTLGHPQFEGFNSVQTIRRAG
ncbi:MAG: antibiotic biosynthesis monooxygenase [Gammaproteobacteria bacterium]|nr:antibiotic biosynthesis monooxygenase [Gammaproteobacteria bacterium]